MGEIRLTDNSLEARTRALYPKVERAVAASVDRFEPVVETDAKGNAPWSDQTANARNGLHTYVEHATGRHRLTLSHGVPYGIWLELKESGKYEIIMPVILRQGRLLMISIRGLLGRLK